MNATEEMSKRGNAVIAGDVVFAGIDADDICEIKNAIVIEFKDPLEMRKAIQTGVAEFTIFECDEQI